MLDAHQLNVFLAAAETLNFSVAAKRLHMTQPSVSQHIQTLEQQFGEPLFLRQGRHISLTDAGTALMPLARQMVALSMKIEEAMTSGAGEVQGPLRVGCSTTPGKYILPHVLAQFLRHYPNVQAVCNVTSRQTVLQMLTDGAAHIALSSASEFQRNVEFRRFLTDPVVLIAPPDHPWAERAELEPEELLEGGFILREETSGTYNAVRQALAEVGLPIERLRRVLTLGNSEAIAFSVQEKIGVGFVSRMVASRLVSEQTKVISVRGLAARQEVYIGRYIHLPPTAAQTAFWEFVASPDMQTLVLKLTAPPAEAR